MARLASAVKGGYYPLPEIVTPLIASHISSPQGGRILDPCAGKGVALVTIAITLNLEAYGVELNQARAHTATDQLQALAGRQGLPLCDHHPTRFIQGDYRTLVTIKGGYNLLYLNPPYDFDQDAGRLEYQWLRDCRKWLQPDGLLVYVVPQKILGYSRIARYLATWFSGVRIYRFPDEEYPVFKQVVLFGRRRPRAQRPEPDQVQRYRDMADLGLELNPLTAAGKPTYVLPKPIIPSKRFVFRSEFIDPEDAEKEAGMLGLQTLAEWRQHLAPANGQAKPVTPLVPLKIGHMAGLIAAGFLDNQVLEVCPEPNRDDECERLLVKGRAYKKVTHSEAIEQLPSGGQQLVRTATENVVTDVTTITPDGEVMSYQGTELERFMTKWLPQLTHHVASNYPPAYAFDYQDGPYARILNRLSLQRPIPTLGRGGLLPAQKHAAAALVQRLEKHSDALLVGEMGTGKTTCAVAVSACLEAKRTLVLCPPHLVKKWKREAEIVWPECQVKILKTISDVQTWFKLNTAKPRVAVLSHSKAKLASGWRHAYNWWQPRKETVEKHAVRLEAKFGNDWRKRMREVFARYQQNRGLRCPTCGASQFDKDGLPVWPEDFEKSRRRRSCPHCQAPLYQFDRRRSKKQQPGSFQEYARREAIIKEALANPSPWTAERLSSGYFPEPEGYARWPLADYIRTHYKGQVDLFIADEIHQFKASDSDQGYAFHDLVCAARKTLGLTGTIFGGKASSLFHLLYRLAPEIQRAFTDEEQSGQRRLRWKQWVSTYGVLQEIETSKIDPHSGKLTGNSRSNVRTKELPGASPAMLPWLLNRAVFISLADMGFALPDYEEIPVTISMSAEMAMLYTSLYKQLHEELKERLVRNDKSLLGAYLQSLLSWVDSPWRPEIVIDPHTKDREDEGIEPRVIAEVPRLPADQFFPKEKAIIDLIQKEKRAGRRCMLFCQQTASRDITPRWREILAQAGLKAAVLKVDPERREAWVAKQVEDGVDVIITHPRRVETGMDLLDFPTLIWMGTEYSVYTVLQASRRSWRIGQQQPVKVYFFNYADTLQNDALYLIAAKVAATVRVNGDVVGGDSLAELDELASTDMVTALARIVTEDEKHQVKGLNDVFAEANADMKSANDYIGAFEMPDEALPDVMPEPENQVSRPQILVRRARIEVTPDDQFVAIPVNGHNDTGLNGAAMANGKMPVIEDDEDPTAVPRPRLIFGQTKPSKQKARKRRSSKNDGRNLSLFDALS
jgi:hypothetical protein